MCFDFKNMLKNSTDCSSTSPSDAMNQPTHKTLHFDLSHVPADQPLTVKVGSQTYELKAHTAETRPQAQKLNPALALIPATHLDRLTHYAEVPHTDLAEHRPTRITVTLPPTEPGHLPPVVHMAFHIPPAHKEQHYAQKLATTPTAIHPKLSLYNAAVPEVLTTEILEAADNLQTPLDVAKSLLFMHPELGSRDPYTATIVMEDHIASADNLDNLNQLAKAISRQGKTGWATSKPSTDKDGNVLTYGYKVGSHEIGEQVLTYTLSEKTLEALKTPLQQALKTSKNDPRLQNRTWTVNQGTTVVHTQPQPERSPESQPLLARSTWVSDVVAGQNLQSNQVQWQLQDKTGHHGLSVFDDSIRYSDDKTFSIAVRNWYLRTLTAYARFFDDQGNVISAPGGTSILSVFDAPPKKFLNIVTATNCIMGIPVPTDPTTLAFKFPDEAAMVELMFGGLGTSDFDGDVDTNGILLTLIFQYGIPLTLMAAGAAITSTKWFNDFIKDTENIIAAIAVAGPLLAGGVATAAALINVKTILSMAGDVIAGILVSKGLEKLSEYILEKITAAELADELPWVGPALRVAAVVVDAEEMAVTTGEWLSSPATLRAKISRSMDLSVTLTPDPAHGEAGHPETAVWPAVSDHYEVTVQYKGGTFYKQQGQMPATTAHTLPPIVFAGIPAGGQLKITAAIFSKNNWLCGKWESDWLSALPDPHSGTKTVTGAITEILVPLTADTQYQYKEKIVYDPNSQKHVWQAGNLPTATKANLDCSAGGNHLCQLVDISFNGGAFQVGYAWQASGLGLPLSGSTSTTTQQAYAFQNLSVLADPESRRITPNKSFGAQSFVAYDQFGAQPTDASAPKTISQRNFVIDPRVGINGKNHLRQLVLDNGTNIFDVDAADLPSWGQFNLDYLDAIVVHPQGVVIGVSWEYHKMELLQLPEAPTDDQNAPIAQLVSGYGVRQGLLNGPKAITVTLDGRVLVLETLNQRIQAFDTKGNPVACFEGALLFTLDLLAPEFEGFQTTLDKGIFPAVLQTAFQQNRLTHLFDLDAALQADLEGGKVTDALRSAFQMQGIQLSYELAQPDDPAVSSYIQVKTAGTSWSITDPGKNSVYDIQKDPQTQALRVYDYLNNVEVVVRSPGSEWIVTDLNGSRSYCLQMDPGTLTQLYVKEYLSYMPLHNPEQRTDISYLDLAIEAKGYIYVLSHTGDGFQPSDYLLDIYEPNGKFLTRTPDATITPNPQHICAARMAIDIWRNLYTLNFEAILGPDGRTEPSISHWLPSPPLFSVDVSLAASLNIDDQTAIRPALARNLTLSPQFTVVTLTTDAHWRLFDVGTKQTYDIVRAMDGLYIYLIPTQPQG